MNKKLFILSSFILLSACQTAKIADPRADEFPSPPAALMDPAEQMKGIPFENQNTNSGGEPQNISGNSSIPK